MKKIAFVATGYILKYDGISVYTENLLLEFLSILNDKKDYQIDVYTGQSVVNLLKERIFKENLNNLNINIISVKDNKFISKIIDLNIKLIRNGKYDLIFMSNFMPTLCLPSKTMKVIHDFSVNHFSELYSKNYLKYHDMLLWYAKKFDYAIGYISNTTLADMEKFHKINPKNKELLYLPNGIPFKVKNYIRPQIQIIKNKYLTNNLELLVVGRINKHKGFDRILEFCKYFDKHFQEINKFESVKLNIVGKQTKETEDIFKDLDLKHLELDFHGFLYDEELNKLYAKSHFCLFLSRNEGYGIPLVEAMWFNSIPIISNIPIFSEVMGENYIKFDDKTGYQKAIVDFILNIFESEESRQNQQNIIELIVKKESNGYKLAANNLVNFIEKIKE
ncbi:glycosyltransferase [bacterium]|jgi:glycosyltransferase involved in cell wall biosynthesis|nr:glycosyltransferase [bacterium]